MNDEHLQDRIIAGLSSPQGDPKTKPAADLLKWIDRPIDIQQVLETGLIQKQGSDKFLLTPEALAGAKDAWRRMTKRGFDEGLVQNMQSAAYMAYNQEVYGTDRFQFNMISVEEAQQIANFSNLSAGMRFVDLGCATGTTCWLADTTEATGVGLDFAPRAIAEAQRLAADRDDVTFAEADLNDLESPEEPFDVAFALDTLYFAADLNATLVAIGKMLKPGGRLVAPYTDNVGQPRAAIDPERCKLGVALDQLGWEWVAMQTSSQQIWQRAVDALTRLKPMFNEEGSEQIWRSREREATEMLAAWEEDRAQRWIFVARPSAPEAPEPTPAVG